MKVCLNNITVNQVSRTIAYTKNNPVRSQKKLTNTRAEVLRTTQALEKNYSPKTGKWFLKNLWNWVKFQQISCIKFCSPQIHWGKIFFFQKKKKKKKKSLALKKKFQAFFFASVWRIIFSPLLTLLKKKSCLQLQKSLCEEQKKNTCLLANIYAN